MKKEDKPSKESPTPMPTVSTQPTPTPMPRIKHCFTDWQEMGYKDINDCEKKQQDRWNETIQRVKEYKEKERKNPNKFLSNRMFISAIR
jgi:hypothetical protein